MVETIYRDFYRDLRGNPLGWTLNTILAFWKRFSQLILVFIREKAGAPP